LSIGRRSRWAPNAGGPNPQISVQKFCDTLYTDLNIVSVHLRKLVRPFCFLTQAYVFLA